jgi:hypothetical protein
VGRLIRFERDPAGTLPGEVRSLFRATEAFYGDEVEAGLSDLRHRFSAALRQRQELNRANPTPAAPAPAARPSRCHFYAEKPLTNADVLTALKRTFRRAARPRRAGRPHARSRGRSRCRREVKGRSSARSGDSPDGEPEPGLAERLLLAQLAWQASHIEQLGEALDEAIEALAELRAELDAERGGE